MEIREERLQWLHDAQNLDQHVDQIVKSLKEDADAVPVAYMSIDMTFRMFLKWIHSAQLQNINATLTRNAAVYLIHTMIMEICSRMNSAEDGLPKTMEWLDAFLEQLRDDMDEDARRLFAKNNANNDNLNPPASQ